MSNVSSRFTFRDGRTYLTGYPRWPGVHNLNDPAYSGYDTLYIGEETPDQNQYFIIGPGCPTTDTPKISTYDNDDGFREPVILSPGLHVFSAVEGRIEHTLPTDTPNILATLTAYADTFSAARATQAPKIICVANNETVTFNFPNNQYQPGRNFLPDFDISSGNRWTPTLILPVGNFTAEMDATQNGYSISGSQPNPGVSVYVDGVEKKTTFTQYFTVPVLFEYGPRYHFQTSLAIGEHFYDTCYFFRSVNLTNTAIQPGGQQ